MSHGILKRRAAALALACVLALAGARPVAATQLPNLWNPVWVRLAVRLTSLLSPAGSLVKVPRAQAKRGLEIDPGGCPDNGEPAGLLDESCVAQTPPTRTAP